MKAYHHEGHRVAQSRKMTQDQDMTSLGEVLFRLLREMDEEATTIRDGSPTGLWWFGAHVKPMQKRPKTEPCWSESLATKLRKLPLEAGSEVAYPKGRLPGKRDKKCDLVVSLPSGLRVWIEVKGSWKKWWEDRRQTRSYLSHLLHPLVPGLDASKDHTAATDISKLSVLRKSEADAVGLLLVGFDAISNPMDSEVLRLADLGGLNTAPWRASHVYWHCTRRAGERVACWFWWRPVE